MPDAPDWYTFQLSGQRHVLGDMAELASRLGSPNFYDRGGQTIFMDDMSTGLSPYTYASWGDGADVGVQAEDCEVGGFALYLTGGKDSYQTGHIVKYLAPQLVNKWGLEIGLALPLEYEYFTFYLGKIVPPIFYQARIWFDPINDVLEYSNYDGDRTTLAALPDLVEAYAKFNSIKLVVDMITNKYVELWINNLHYNMSGLDIHHLEAEDKQGARAYCLMKSRYGYNDKCLLDRLLITTGEP